MRNILWTAPLILISGLLGQTSTVTLTWTDNSTNEARFEVERQDGPTGTFTKIGQVNANTATFTDASQFPRDTPLTYQVRACNIAGCSAYSNRATVTVPSIPAAPTGLTIEIIVNVKVTMEIPK